MEVPTLAAIAVEAVLVDAAVRCPDAERLLARHPDVTCIVVRAGDRLDVLTRRRFTLEMAGPIGYGRALHAHRPLSALVDPAVTLSLAADCPLTTAGRLALERPRGRRYDDLLVCGPGDDEIRTVSVADLFTALAHLHEQRALRDDLTGLANRAGFAAAVAGALEAGEPVAVLYIDLDEFKAVNDSLGHSAGDALLVAMAERLAASSRGVDVVARLGGDEFGMLLSGVSPDEANRMAERLLDVLRAPVAVDGRSLTMRASIGIAPHEDAGTWEDLLRNADLAMYEAKRSGKGQLAGYDAGMHDRAVARLSLSTDLDRAVGRGELRLQYQPIVALAEAQTIGVEALVRWQHPARGLISPLDFIPAAEQSGAILAIGDWVLREACMEVGRWGDELRLGVNVSVRQLEAPGFAGAVRRVLAESGVEASRLILEVTESALARETGAVLDTLTELDDDGVQLAIDDFGTGYSSFARLDRLPVGMLKIDRSFTCRLSSGRGLGVMRGLLGMAEAMGLTALVEGVETADQAVLLRELGVELVQGFLFARPLDSDDLTALLGAGDPV